MLRKLTKHDDFHIHSFPKFKLKEKKKDDAIFGTQDTMWYLGVLILKHSIPFLKRFNKTKHDFE
jgi:hypothetical protein